MSFDILKLKVKGRTSDYKYLKFIRNMVLTSAYGGDSRMAEGTRNIQKIVKTGWAGGLDLKL